MSKYLTIVTAVSALAIATPTATFAQTTTDQTQPNLTEPQTQQGSQEPSMAQPSMAEGEFLAMQEPGQMRTSQWLGTSVRNEAGEVVGDVNDIVLDEGNQVAALVVGVGGFLGIGEKRVALPISAVEMAQADDGQRIVRVTYTKRELEQAPEFQITGATTMSERVDQARDAASETYQRAKDSVQQGYERAKDAVTGEGSTTSGQGSTNQ